MALPGGLGPAFGGASVPVTLSGRSRGVCCRQAAPRGRRTSVRCTADIVEPLVAPEPRPAPQYHTFAPPDAVVAHAVGAPAVGDWAGRRLLEHSFARQGLGPADEVALVAGAPTAATAAEAATATGPQQKRWQLTETQQLDKGQQECCERQPGKQVAAAPPHQPHAQVGQPTTTDKQQQRQQQQQQMRHQQRQGQRRPRVQPLAPCTRKLVMDCARSAQRHVRGGKAVRLPAESDGQAVAALKALTYARTMVLAHGGAGLAFQPSKGAAPLESGQPPGGAGLERSSTSPGARPSKRAASAQGLSNGDSSSSSSSSSSNSAAGGVVLWAMAADESCLVRFDPSPLVATRHGGSEALACALLARVAGRGFTTLRAIGPDATCCALNALLRARQALQRQGSDLAVIPARHAAPACAPEAPSGGAAAGEGWLDGAPAASAAWGGSWEDDEAEDARFMSSVSLHVVRCAPSPSRAPRSCLELQPRPLGASPARARRRAAAAPLAADPAAAGAGAPAQEQAAVQRVQRSPGAGAAVDDGEACPAASAASAPAPAAVKRRPTRKPAAAAPLRPGLDAPSRRARAT